MTAEELKKIIFEELNARKINSLHGITNEKIDQFLIEPKSIELIDFLEQRNKYWLVLDEIPEDVEKGYCVIYDEREEMFGLAVKSTSKDSDIGFLVGLYGSFVDALDNM